MTISTLLSDIAARYRLKRKSGKWVGACPECGGSATSDKFNLRDDGGFKCYACDFKGDVITLLRKLEGLSCPDAHERAGKDCRAAGCQVRDKCRLGSGEKGARRQYRPASVRPRQANSSAELPVTAVSFPCASWLRWADALLAKARENILQDPDVLQWLAGRGLDLDAVKRFGLGWLKHSEQVDRQSIGLAPLKDGKTRLWIPDGLLIPIFDRRGVLHRLRVRRSEEARAKFLPDLKYVWLEGSGTGPLVIRPQAGQQDGNQAGSGYRGVVIEEAELDSYATAAAHDAVMVIGIGTVSAGLPSQLATELQQAQAILVALDAEEGKDGKPGPGPKAYLAWQKKYSQARFWPVPAGKDAGDYYRSGGDLRLWIESGLPPVAAAGQNQAISANQPSPPAPVHEQAFSPEHAQRGDGGVVDISAEKTDPAVLAISALPEPVQSDAMSFYHIMQGHPVTAWMSPDGFDVGIIDVHGDWRQNNLELSDKFTRLFYGPAHGDLCRIFKDRFIRNARQFEKCACGREGN